MADISSEVSQLQNAVLGEEVRSAFISCMQKINKDNEKYQSIKSSVEASAKTVSEQVAAINTKKTEVETSIQNLTAKISEANTTKKNLGNATDLANTAKTNLTNTTKTANDEKTALEASTTAANTTMTNLQKVVDSASDVNSNIGASVTRANNAASDANAAAQAATNSANKAETAAVSATDTAATASRAATAANGAAASANDSAGKADTATANANEATSKALAAAKKAGTDTANAIAVMQADYNQFLTGSQNSLNAVLSNFSTEKNQAITFMQNQVNTMVSDGNAKVEAMQKKVDTAVENANTATDAANAATDSANQAAEKVRDDCYPMLFRDFDGKDYSVFFMAPEDSMVSIGTKQDDNAGLATPTPSTNSTRNPNVYDEIPLFKTYECNGYVDADGEPHITAIKGEPGFRDDGTNGDVCVAFKTGYIRRIIDTVGENSPLGAKGEKVTITDTWRKSEYSNHPFIPYAGAIRPDGTVRPYILIPKYQAVTYNDMYYSLPGSPPVYNVSHNNQITAFRKRGTQYCGETSKDSQVWETLFEVMFATMTSQSIMQGCTNYSAQYKAVVEEENVERIILTKSQAAYFIVGSCVSIGEAAANTNLDRAYAYMHNLANRVKVTAIENLEDGVNAAVYVDNGGTKFNTTATTYISTMPWYTGSTDKVLGTCGSPNSYTNAKEPFKFMNLELALGQYVVKSDIILNGIYDSEADTYEQQVWICNDCSLFATSVTGNYTRVGFNIPDTNNSWKYIRTLGFDKMNPSVRGATDYTGANSGNRYGDAVHTGGRANGTREFLSLGSLWVGSYAGLRVAFLSSSLGSAYWSFSARPSLTGKCGTVADWAARMGVNLAA